MKKINLEVTCKRNRFGYWNSCKRLPNFVNVAALLLIHDNNWNPASYGDKNRGGVLLNIQHNYELKNDVRNYKT